MQLIFPISLLINPYFSLYIHLHLLFFQSNEPLDRHIAFGSFHNNNNNNNNLDEPPETSAMMMGNIWMSSEKPAGTPDATQMSARLSYLSRSLKHGKNRWEVEYLSQVHKHQQTMSRPLAVGDVVFVLDDTKRKQFWRLGRIIELFPGRDGKRRVAKVKLTTSTLLRPIQRLVPLEVSSQDVAPGLSDTAQPPIVPQQPAYEPSAPLTPPRQQEMTRSGRVVRAPCRF